MNAQASSTAPAPAPAASPALARRLARGLGWALTWLIGMVLGLALALAVALWLWSGSDGSLAQTLRWAQNHMDGQSATYGLLRLDGDSPRGNLRQGGHMPQLQWSHDGLSVTATGTTLQWPDLWTELLPRLWQGKGLRLVRLQIDHLDIADQRPSEPGPPPPLEQLPLPLPLDLPFSIGRLTLSGPTTLEAGPISGQYRYTDAQHTIALDTLVFAQGRYRLQAQLDAAAPMALSGQLQGELTVDATPAQPAMGLQAQVAVQGQLSGPQAALTLSATASADPASHRWGDRAPRLDATAEIHPWAAQPLHTAQARFRHLDLAVFWPDAPRTAMSGAIDARPSGSGGDMRWQAVGSLDNATPGPWDRQRLPVERLRARVVQRSAGQWELSELDATAGGGRLQGQGRVDLRAESSSAVTPSPAPRLQGWQGTLRWSGLNPASVLSHLPDQALNAELTAQDSRGVTGFSLSATATRTARQGPTLEELVATGQWQAPRLRLSSARVRALNARLNAQGTVDTHTLSFDGQADMAWPGGQMEWQGSLGPRDGQARLVLNLQDAARSQRWVTDTTTLADQRLPPAWRDTRLQGQARLDLDWQGGWQTAQAWTQRPLSTPPFRIQATLAAPRLQVGAGGDGAPPWTLQDSRIELTHSGGTWSVNPTGRLQGQAIDLTLDAQAQVRHGADALTLDIARLNTRVRMGQAPPAFAQWQWHAPQALRARWTPTAWELSPGLIEMQRGHSAPPGNAAERLQLRWDTLQGGTDSLQTRGSLLGLPLAWIDGLPRETPDSTEPQGLLQATGLGTDLVFDAHWDVVWPGIVSGRLGDARARLQLQRRSGDLDWRPDANGVTSANAGSAGPIRAGVRQAGLQLDLDGLNLRATATWDSERAGQASASLNTRLSHTDGMPTWPVNAPLDGQLQARLPQLGVWSVLAPPGWRISGAIEARSTITGTRAQPRLNGLLQASELALRNDVEGLAFTNGRLRATLQGERVHIETLRIEGSGGEASGGVLSATGSAEWVDVGAGAEARREPRMALQVQARALRASTRADRRLTLSGDLLARLEGTRLRLGGDLRADQALFLLPDELAPTLGDDVRVRGRTATTAPQASARRVVPDVDVNLDLGNRFEVRGHGLQTRLRGQLNVRSAPQQAAPRILGEVRTAAGTYRAYGQRLDIEEGVLRFSGPYDNPSLDVLAIRPFTTQRVGVQIRGTARAPQVRLYSEPDLPDSEKLAWLVLGRPATGAGAEAAVLQQAALALLSGSGSGPSLGESLGLDELSLRGATDGEAGGAALTLGKRLSSRLYVSYERTLAGALGTFAMFYDISRRLTLRARAGEDNALDLLFTLNYD